MPQAIPFLIDVAIKIAAAVIQAAVIYGVEELMGLHDVPSPESSKVPVKQPIPPKQIAYGYGRLSGPYAYWRTVGKYAIDVIMLCKGPAESIDFFYLNDDLVELVDNVVQAGDDGRYHGDIPCVWIYHRTGVTPETAYAEVIAESDGEWTADHRLDGVASMAILAHAVNEKNITLRYPNGPVLGSAVGAWRKCYDWRLDETMPGGMTGGAHRRDDSSTWEWTENPLVAFVHNEWFEFGRDFDYRFLPTLEQLTAAADICDEELLDKDSVAVARYAMFGWFQSNTPRKDVRRLFLASMDALMIERGDGAFVIHPGKYEEPTVTLNEDRIKRFRWRRRRRAEETVNRLGISYNSPAHDYTMVETNPWTDPVSIAAIGEQVRALELTWCTNNNQARRQGKIVFARANAEYDGFVEIDLSEDEAELEHRWFRIKNQRGPASMWDVVVEVTGVTLDVVNRLVRIEFIKADPDSYEFDAVTEEGTGPGSTIPGAPGVTAAPVILDVQRFGAGDIKLAITIENQDRDDYLYAFRWRVDGDSAWTEGSPQSPVDDGFGDLLIQTGPTDDVALEVAVAAVASGSYSTWSDLVDVAAA